MNNFQDTFWKNAVTKDIANIKTYIKDLNKRVKKLEKKDKKSKKKKKKK